MGQQQLLLVILVTIIVGIATVVAINTFGSAAESANLDAVRNDVAAIASSAQGYFIRPAMLGGGGNNFTQITFEQVTFPGTISDNNLVATNANGTYQIFSRAEASFVIRAYPSSQGGLGPDNAPVTTGAYLEATVSANNIAWVGGATLQGGGD